MAGETFGYVYFVEAEGQERIKVGWTIKNPSNRIHSLQVGSCVRLLPIGVLIGPHGLEREVHAMLAEWRLDGEWFRATQTLRDFIQEVSYPWPKSKDRIARPGVYQFKESLICHRAFPCDQCGAKVSLDDPWFLYESGQGDKSHVCLKCIHVPDNRLKKRISVRACIEVGKLIFVANPSP